MVAVSYTASECLEVRRKSGVRAACARRQIGRGCSALVGQDGCKRMGMGYVMQQQRDTHDGRESQQQVAMIELF